MRIFGVGALENKLAHLLLELGFASLKNEEISIDVKSVAKFVLELSEHFQRKEKITPWQNKGHQAAYIAYFLPLGIARAKAVLDESKRWGLLSDVTSYTDFGSGPGTMSLVLEGNLHGRCLEASPEAIALHQKLNENKNIKWINSTSLERSPSQPTLLTMSYALNELTQIPQSLFEYDKVLIIEPSTREGFVRLSQLRTQLIENGYTILAPCTHHNKCPLVSSGKDWCHDRIQFSEPYWWQELEKHLPMKNKTITMSYLLARKETSQAEKSTLARIVGDALLEKGKTRQLVCRSSEREFFAWLHKRGEVPDLHRGDLLELLAEPEKVSNELRQPKFKVLSSSGA